MLGLLIQSSHYCFSQNRKLIISPPNYPKNCNECFSFNKKDLQKNIDSLSVTAVNCIRTKGYLSASLDSIINKEDTSVLYIFFGNKYTWNKIELKSDPLGLIPNSIKKNKILINKPADYNRLSNIKKAWLSSYENSGYPFVNVVTDSLEIFPEQISITCEIEPGSFISYDSLDLTGTKRISPRFIQNYLGIFPGKTYIEKRILTISKRIKELSFVTESKPTEIYFINNKAKVRLFLKDKKTNQFNGILGIMPNNNKPGKFILTGDISLNLDNTFKHGDKINFVWKKLESSSQNLLISFEWPYLFNTPLGTDLFLKLYKKDSSFVNVTSHLGLPFYFSGSNNLGLYYENTSSTLLTTSSYISATSLPLVSSFNSSIYGISFAYSSLNYKQNPSKGVIISFKAGYGKKIIEKIPEINPQLYENFILQSFRNEMFFDASLYNPLYKNLIIKIRGQVGYINSKNLLTNELYRIGGLNSLRGFDEESLYASVYGIETTEIRYLFEKNSAFFLFYDQAAYQNSENNTDFPLGFGAGISFQTGAGIFTLSYALGKEQNNPIEFRNARIHFGFINRF